MNLRETKTVLIVESLPLFKQALINCLQRSPTFTFNCFDLAPSQLWPNRQQLLSFDLIILDISQNLKKVLKRIKQIKQQLQSKVLAVDTYPNYGNARRCFFNLADGYIGKNSPEEEFLTALAFILNDKKFIPPKLKEDIWNWFVDPQYGKMDLNIPSKREMEVLKLIVQEYSTPEIAKALYISKCTVETHRVNLLQKFEVKNTAGLVREALLQFRPDILLERT